MKPSVFSLWLASLLACEAGAFVAKSSSISQSRLESHQLFERKPFITGNWKLNPQTKDEAIALAQGIADSVSSSSPGDVGLFVPFPFIETVQKIAGDKFVVGAEVCFVQSNAESLKQTTLKMWRNF